MLWGRSGNKCAICKTDLAEDMTETDDYSILGEEAHIVAREEDGPRGKSPLTSEERDKYSNLILLCQKHHKIIDDHDETYTIEKLHEIKSEHIQWVKVNLNPDIDKQKDDETYATYIEEFIKLAGIETWNIWTSHVLSGGQPQIIREQYDNLYKLNEYLLARIWPKRYPNLEFAFTNFRQILNDFLRVLSEHLDKSDNDWYMTKSFYREYRGGDSSEYDEGVRKFDYHVDLIQDLMLELTRAANYLIVQIRYYISSSFRTHEGLLLITTGPDMSFSYTTVRLEFSSNNIEDIHYKGLRDFMTTRENRSYHFGQGVSEDYFFDERMRKMMEG